MHMTATIVAAYGLFSLVGGVIGYVKAKSAASLIAGGVSGALLLLCAYGIGQQQHAALIGSLVIALALGGRFAGTWFQKRRLMPDLLMVLFSVAVALAVGSALLSQ